MIAIALHDDPPPPPVTDAWRTFEVGIPVEFVPAIRLAVPKSDERRLSKLKSKIVRVCRHDFPMKGSIIGKRIGHAYDGYLRQVLAEMTKAKILRRSTDGGGYLLP